MTTHSLILFIWSLFISCESRQHTAIYCDCDLNRCSLCHLDWGKMLSLSGEAKWCCFCITASSSLKTVDIFCFYCWDHQKTRKNWASNFMQAPEDAASGLRQSHHQHNLGMEENTSSFFETKASTRKASICEILHTKSNIWSHWSRTKHQRIANSPASNSHVRKLPLSWGAQIDEFV